MKSPGRSFLAGLTAWGILTVTYSVTELAFPRLATRLRLSPVRSRVRALWLFGRDGLGNESRNQSSPSAASTAHAKNRLPIELNRSSLRPERLVPSTRPPYNLDTSVLARAGISFGHDKDSGGQRWT